MENEIVYSVDGEFFGDTEIEEMAEIHNLTPPFFCWMGEKKEVGILDFFDFEVFVEQLQDRAYEYHGIEDDYLENISKDAELELKDFLEKWAKKNKLEPKFYGVTNTKEICVINDKEFGGLKIKDD